MFKSLPHKDEHGQWVLELDDLPDSLQEEFDNFFKNYSVDDIFFHPERKPKLKPKAERVCVFCKSSMPKTTFRMEAHTIPQLTGNRNLVSDFECDKCNGLFSQYESELTKFLGLSRTLSFLKGQVGIPKYKTPDQKLEVGEDKNEKKIKIISEGLDTVHWEIDDVNRKLTIHSVKHPYIPVKVFKSLIKMGLCHIDDTDISMYESIYQLLQSNENDKKVKGHPLFKLYIHLFPGAAIPFPVFFRMKRKPDATHEYCPNHCFVLYFGNYIFQFFLPGFTPDKEIFVKNKKVHLPLCPPLLGKAYCTYFGIPKRGIYDLSGAEKIVNETQKITMSFDSVHYPS